MGNRTITATVYSEAGGVGKTTITATLLGAWAREGLDVLGIDLDPQDGSLSYLLDVDDRRDEPEADSLVRHLVDKPRGPFEDLIREAELGIDVVPSHNLLGNLPKLLDRAAEQEQDLRGPGYEYPRNQQLLRVLRENDVNEEYDAILVDPQASEGPALHNAIYATRHLIIPIELTGKGEQSVVGLQNLVGGLERELGIEVGVLATVPNGFSGTNDQREYLERIEDAGYSYPIVIRERGSLMEGCWRTQTTPWTYIEEHRAPYDYERETLEGLEQLAGYIVEQVRMPEVEA